MSRALLQTVLSLPTAPFHEDIVAAFVSAFASEIGLKTKKDKWGNLYVSYKRGKGATPLVFLAHMDHPGFSILRHSGKTVVAGLLGAGGIEPYLKGACVRMKFDDVWVKGTVTRLLPNKWKGRQTVEIRIPKADAIKGRRGEYGYLDFPPVKIKKECVYTKGADDIANVASILSLLARLVREKATADVVAVFTRAEEVGFVGAIEALRAGHVSKKRIVFVCETSSANFGGITIGGGVTIRVGDKAGAYSPEVDYWAKNVALEKKIPFQRALLQGGQCEACLFALSGYATGGIIIPLGNYHNIHDGPKKRVAPEFIHLSDYDHIIDLMMALSVAKPPSVYLRAFHTKLDQRAREWRDLWR